MILAKLDCQRALVLTPAGIRIVDMLPSDPVDTGPDAPDCSDLAPVMGAFFCP